MNPVTFTNMTSYVLNLQDVDKRKRLVVGGKGANLGELTRIEGIRVPVGFCICTEAFERIINETPSGKQLERLKHLPDGEQKAKETKEQISLLRNFAGYREYPKYSIVSRYLVYKQALLEEAERLVAANVIHERGLCTKSRKPTDISRWIVKVLHTNRRGQKFC